MIAEDLFRVLGISVYTPRHKKAVESFVQGYVPGRDIGKLLTELGSWSDDDLVKATKWFDKEVWPISVKNELFTLIRNSDVAFTNKLNDNECSELEALIETWLRKKAEPIESLMGDEETDEEAIPLKSIGL